LKVGISIPQLGEQLTKENIINISKDTGKEGFNLLCVLERLLLPLKTFVPYLSTLYGSLPIEYQSIFYPLEVLTFVGVNTKKISLGSGVLDIF